MLALVLAIIASMFGLGEDQPGVPMAMVPSYRLAVGTLIALATKLARMVFLVKSCLVVRRPVLNEVIAPQSRSSVASAWAKVSLSELGPWVVAQEPAGPIVP